MNTKPLLLAFLGFSSLSAAAQVGKKIAETLQILGTPVKEFNVEPTPTKIFIKEKVQAQISFENGVANGGVYHVAMIINGMKQPISDEQLKMIYGWNGIAEGDLVAVKFKELPQLDGIYQKTKDGKLLVMDNKKKNMVSVLDSRGFVKCLESLKKP
jgi:hypothetical protein